LLRQIDGRVHVMDWRSPSGTFVNGARIESEVAVASGDEIRIGDYIISFEVPGVDHPPSAGQESVTAVATQDNDHPGQNPTGLHDATGNPQPCWRNSTHPHPQTAAAAADPPPRSATPAPVGRQQTPVAPQQQEMLTLLQAEVEQLQLELADRDARLAEAMAWADDASVAAPPDRESAETEALAKRLEELLDELQGCDEKISSLEEQRRLTEEACEAEREERRQIEAWLDEIELRVAQRDRERAAENESLRRRLSEMADARRHLEQRLKDATAQAGPDNVHHQLLQPLRDENAQLQQRIEEAAAARVQLERKLRDRERQAAPQTTTEVVDNALREERIRMARERAELARQRNKLLEMQGQLEKQISCDDRSFNEGDTRLRAFRDHLREIHEDEQRARKENTLVHRLARLWKRLDG